MNVFLTEPFKTLWHDKDVFVEAEALQGEVYRALEARKTLRTQVGDQGYFVKIHRGVGWPEILKNLFSLRLPILGARNEFDAIKRLTAVNVATMTAVAFASKGRNPAKQHSFIITEELAPTISLEDLSLHWAKTPPDFAMKRALIKRVAQMVRAMHQAGVNHRDCYICHFLLHTDKPFSADDFKLSLIDLHRAQIRAKTPMRWRDKDLAALYYSTLEIGLTRNDKLMFMKEYFSLSLKALLNKEAVLLKKLNEKAQKLDARQQRHGGAL